MLKTQPTGRDDCLKAEYDLLRRLDHPQIPRRLAYLEWEGQEYLVREYVQGVSLYQRPPFPIPGQGFRRISLPSA